MPTIPETKSTTFITLPNSVEAEQNVLGCIMKDQLRQLDIIAQLKPDDFYQPNHRIIFEAMSNISRQTHKVGEESRADSVSITTVIDYLRRKDQLATVGDIDYLLKLNDAAFATSNYAEYVSIVKRASTMRKLIDICHNVEQKAYSSSTAEEAITYAEEEIFKLSQGGSNGGLVPLGNDAARAMYTISERFVNPGKFRGIDTGFARFDRMTNGLHGGELVVLAARPGVGKSSLAMNIVENVAKQGKTVAVFSLEMSNEQLVERMLSGMSTVPLEFIKSGQLPHGEADLVKLRAAQETICSSMSLYGNDYASIKPAEIASQCRRLKAQNGLDLIVIDYIQLMSDGTGATQGRQQEVANISRALKLLAKELNVPVIALSQLKRDAEIRNIKGKEGGSSGSEPVLSDLRESGAIEQDADIVLFIHKESDSESGTTKHSLIIAKHRNGETGNIPLHWLGKFVRFVDDDYLAQHAIRPEEPQKQSDGGEDREFIAEQTEGEFVASDDEFYSQEETFEEQGTSDGDLPPELDNIEEF